MIRILESKEFTLDDVKKITISNNKKFNDTFITIETVSGDNGTFKGWYVKWGSPKISNMKDSEKFYKQLTKAMDNVKSLNEKYRQYIGKKLVWDEMLKDKK